MRSVAAIGPLMLAVGLVVLPASGLPQGKKPTVPAVSGNQTYRTYCAVCHGEKGKGDGPLAGGLRFLPPDLTLMAKDNGGEYPAEMVARIVDGSKPVAGHGGNDMPAWGDAFKNSGSDDEKVDQQIQAVVAYVGRLQEK